MTGGDWHRFYVPEVHDLYPGMMPGADALAALLPRPARDRIAWSIVPNWQDRLPLDADPAAAAGFAALPGLAVLHGWTHSLGPDLLNWLLYGHDNRSEFQRLSRERAAERLDRAVRVFTAALGRRPEWFCAPRWQLSRGAEAELRARGFRGHLGRTGIEVYGQGRIPMPALNFDEGERAWKTALAIRARRPAIRRLLAAGRPFRFVVHPGDALHPATRAQLVALAADLQAQGWRPVALEDAVELWRARAA